MDAELSYADIAADVGITNGHRRRRAVRLVRVIAANRGDRLERFMPSTDQARRRVFVTRYMRHGHGDEFSARDAMSAARAAMTAVEVLAARDAVEHERLVWAWGRDVWQSWSPHHATIRRWNTRALARPRT